MQKDPATSPQTDFVPTTALGQLFAAIAALLIAALAEHARENPSLAGLIRLTIKRLEAGIARFDALVAAHESRQTPATAGARIRASRPGTPILRTPGLQTPGLRPKPIHMKTERRRGAMTSLRLSVSMWNPSAAPRAPP
jgi:hypothetical protein